MKNFSKELKRVYQSEYQMKPWKGLAIYPKIIEQKALADFTREEKKHLTRKGFRWYVYFRYLNPETEKFDKIIAPTLSINRDFPKFKDRYREIKELRESIKQLLEDGKSPFEVSLVDGEVMTIEKAIDYALSNKKLKVSEDTYTNYEIRAKQLKEYLRKKGLDKRDTRTFNFKVIREFLKEVARKSSMKNRNNALRVVKALFTEMYKNDIIESNYVAKIDVEKVHSERFKSYSHKQAMEILDHFENNDPYLALFIKFVGYNFLRPVEVTRLKVGDLDLENKLLSVWVKQGKNKIKRIPDAIIEELSKYDLSKKTNYVFGLKGIGEKWDRPPSSRRQTISKRITKIIRELGYGDGYVLYSFRHTFATIGYKNLRKRLSKDEALDTLMGYTGHSSRVALQSYIHYIDAEIVDEYDGEIL